jgi:hypothetical protein
MKYHIPAPENMAFVFIVDKNGLCNRVYPESRDGYIIEEANEYVEVSGMGALRQRRNIYLCDGSRLCWSINELEFHRNALDELYNTVFETVGHPFHKKEFFQFMQDNYPTYYKKLKLHSSDQVTSVCNLVITPDILHNTSKSTYEGTLVDEYGCRKTCKVKYDQEIGPYHYVIKNRHFRITNVIEKTEDQTTYVTLILERKG